MHAYYPTMGRVQIKQVFRLSTRWEHCKGRRNIDGEEEMHKFGLWDEGDWSGLVVRAVHEKKGMGDAAHRTGSTVSGTHFSSLPRR